MAHVLLVEGLDDAHVFKHLCTYHHISNEIVRALRKLAPHVINIKDEEGYDNLVGNLTVSLKASEVETIGIIVDADANVGSRWESLRSKLIDSGYDRRRVPRTPERGGTIIEQDNQPLVGVWIMPDNTMPGMLEHFIEFLVPKGDPLWDRAKDCVDQIPEPDRRFSKVHDIKAHVHTWLAWQEEPGKPMSMAITKRYLDATAPHAEQIIDWMTRLFGPTVFAK